jgi:Trypsin-co-occurring domain 1
MFATVPTAPHLRGVMLRAALWLKAYARCRGGGRLFGLSCLSCFVGGGVGVPDFVSLTLDDGSQVLFQSAESDLVSMHSGAADVVSADAAAGRLEEIAKGAQQMCASLRSQMAPDEVQLQIGVGLSAELGWFFAKTTAEGSLTVTLTWKGPAT